MFATYVSLHQTALSIKKLNVFFFGGHFSKQLIHNNVGNVQPIPKKCNRPIAITLFTLSKVLEHIINHKLMYYLENNVLLHARQYGFRTHCFTGYSLAYPNHDWTKTIYYFGESKIITL